jgi:hypothetical protein
VAVAADRFEKLRVLLRALLGLGDILTQHELPFSPLKAVTLGDSDERRQTMKYDSGPALFPAIRRVEEIRRWCDVKGA